MNCGVETKSLSESTLTESFMWKPYTHLNMSGLNYKKQVVNPILFNDSSCWLFRSDLTIYWALVSLYSVSSLYVHLCTRAPSFGSYKAGVWEEKAWGMLLRIFHFSSSQRERQNYYRKASSMQFPSFFSVLAVSSLFLLQLNERRG